MVLDFELYSFEQLLSEGLITTYPADKVVNYIRNKFDLGDDDIDVDHDEFTDYILISKDVKNNEEIYDKIESILKSSGYYFGKTEGVNDAIIVFERKFDEEVFSKLKESGEVKYLYHVSPSMNDIKISNKGLIPKSKNYRFNYPDRIYFFSDKNVLNDINFFKNISYTLYKEMCDNLKDNQKYKVKPNVYSVYRIDISKLDDIKLYRDPNAGNFESYYTSDNIKPSIIEKIDEIKL